MALEGSSLDVHFSRNSGKSIERPPLESYNTPPVELHSFSPIGNIVDAIRVIDGSNNQLVSTPDIEPSSSEHPPASLETVVDSFPDGGMRSWLVVIGSFFLIMASYGMLNSVGVFQSYLETNQLSTYSSTDVGWIPSSFVFFTLLLGVYVGPLFDSYGPKVLVYMGSALLGLRLFLFAECKQYWQFMLCFSLLGGIGAALVSTVAMSCIPHWFEIRAGMAIGTALAGSGLGGAIFPFVLRAGFANIGFKWTMRALALAVGALCLIGSVMVRSRLPKRKISKFVVIELKCFKDLKFTCMTEIYLHDL